MINERMGCVSIEIFAKRYAHGVRRNACEAMPALEVSPEFATLEHNRLFKGAMALRAGQFVVVEEVGGFHVRITNV